MLRIDGEVEEVIEFSFEELAAFPADVQVLDVGRFNPKRPGDGITLDGLLDRVRPKSTATYLTLHATADDFAASIPLAAVRAEGIVVYRLNGQPLPLEKGGPVRFLIPDPAACHTDELDDCANVKFVDRIELTAGRGRDTRPDDEDEHEELHRREAESQRA
ncbi:MAG: molybdopterin-dependent oxidoreductase [Planctomycetota bacterium]|nr:molybdopterin-dependent oxidoreductase [Planctomycetota bacterium]